MAVEWKDISVEGEAVTAEQQRAGFAKFLSQLQRFGGSKYGLGDLMRHLREAGVSDSVGDRAADRMLQKARRAGMVFYQGGRWFAADQDANGPEAK
jgi:hypothetical protein